MLSLFLTIAVVHLVALMSPGPDFFFVSRTAMSQSRSKALLGVLGITGGMFIWAGLSILGLQVLFETVSWLQEVVAIGGGLYLLWMGYGLLKSSFFEKEFTCQTEELAYSEREMKSPFLFGLLTNLANPKAVIYYGSIFSTFITPEVSEVAKFSFFCLVVAESFGWFAFVAMVFGLSQPRRLYRKFSRWIDALAGALFALFGGGLIWANR